MDELLKLIQLNVMERLIIINIMPPENDITKLKIIRDLKNIIGITEDEYKEFEIVKLNNSFKWNENGNERKGFPIGNIALSIIKESFIELNKNKKLTEEMIDVYDKFVTNAN